MSRKRKACVVSGNDKKFVAGLPNELLLEIWDHLPAPERICVSQVCRKWRNIALSIPRLWTCVAVVSTVHGGWCRCDPLPATARSIYHPRSDSDNLEVAAAILLRSRQLPLELVIDTCGSRCEDRFCAVVRPHSGRIVRLHFPQGEFRACNNFIAGLRSLTALHTVTAGFDDREAEYSDPPVRVAARGSLAALTQVHIGAGAADDFIAWDTLPSLSGDRKLMLTHLTLTLARFHPVLNALGVCQNLSRLTLVMAAFVPAKNETVYIKSKIRQFVDALSLVPELCFSDIAMAHEKFILTHFDDRRFRHLTLDYMGRARRPGSSWYLSLPSPCDALADPVQLTLRLRDAVYEIAVVDSGGLRREVFLDRDTIRMAPGLWNCYLKKRTVQRATVDAAAWDYFADGLPELCAIPELDIVVVQHPSELQAVSLSRFTDLERLRIDVAKPGMKFDSAAVQKLVRSRGGQGDEEPLATLLLSPNATYVGDMTRMAAVVNFG